MKFFMGLRSDFSFINHCLSKSASGRGEMLRSEALAGVSTTDIPHFSDDIGADLGSPTLSHTSQMIGPIEAFRADADYEELVLFVV